MKRAALLVLLGSATPAVAGVEIGGTAGVHVFSEDNALGVNVSETADSQKNSSLFGVRVGFYFTPMLGLELEGGVVPSEPRSVTADVTNITYRAHLVAQFRANDIKNNLIPFLSLGGGGIEVYDSTNTLKIHKDRDGFGYLGLGVKYRAPNNWGIRFDLRGLLVPSSVPKSAGSKDGGMTFDVEALLGVYREFGRPHAKKAEKKIEEKPPVKDEDPDKDGIIGDADKCPTEAEDKDEFEDDNGCPELDNDKDEVPDAADKCSKEPEDKDNFKDDDGCPDPDNDEDGVADAADKCNDKAETKNGFEDDDGCPDDVPEPVAKLTGIQPIAFKAGTADIAPASNKTLDAVAKMLVEFKQVKLEIGSHTDDVAPAKGSKFADNAALSQARADAVKAYLVKKGVEEGHLTAKGYGSSAALVDPTGLKGKPLTDARAKNNRVELKLAAGDTPPAATPPAP